MLKHTKSNIIFEDTLIGDYYVLEGINHPGTFRVSTDFLKDFEYVENADSKEKVNKVEWNRALIYYIGESHRKKGKKTKEAHKYIFKNIPKLTIEEGIIKDLVISFPVEVNHVDEMDFNKVLPEGAQIKDSPELMELRFLPVKYGSVIQYGVMINTPYLYYLFSSGRMVLLSNPKPENKGQDAQDNKQEEGSHKVKRSKAKPAAKAFDMKYLEEKLELPATKIRSKLRKHYEKPDGGWKWSTQEEVDEVIKKITSK